MTEVTLEFIAERLEWIQGEQTAIRAEIAAMRAAINDVADGQIVLTQMAFRSERDMVRVKDVLGRLDSRISQFEKTTP